MYHRAWGCSSVSRVSVVHMRSWAGPPGPHRLGMVAYGFKPSVGDGRLRLCSRPQLQSLNTEAWGQPWMSIFTFHCDLRQVLSCLLLCVRLADPGVSSRSPVLPPISVGAALGL